MKHDEPEYLLSCGCTGGRALSASQLEDLLLDADYQCGECGEGLALDAGDLVLECQVCDMTFETESLADATARLDERCGTCSRHDFPVDTIHVPGSFRATMSEYEWVRAGRGKEELVRKGRLDYWEGVVHFCEPHEFASIVTDRVIRASSTGRFGLPAVCLTEVPASDWAEIRQAHGRLGFVFKKHDVIRMGGGPALYLPDHLIDAQKWHPGVAPFGQLLREPAAGHAGRRYNFLHEREWRVPRDILLDETPPHAAIRGPFDSLLPNWRDVFHGLYEFGELET